MAKKTIYWFSDGQVKPGVKNPLIAVAHHICVIKPNEIIYGGDHWDFPSLCGFEKGKKSQRQYSYLKDVRAGNTAMEEFWKIIKANWKTYKKAKWTYLKGNHCYRRERAIEYGPDELIDMIYEFPMDLSGWNVIPFLRTYRTAGISFCHYFQQAKSSGAISSANSILNKKKVSCVAGHSQGFDYAEHIGDTKPAQCIIAGSCYYHKEDYMKHNNHHWRGTVVLRVLRPGVFDFSRHSLSELDAIVK